MSHYVESMAYNQVSVPWHGLGKPVSGNMTPEEMIEAAGLAWKVQKRLVRMKVNPDSDEEVIIPGYNAIVRETDHQVFQIARDRYKIIQNLELFHFLKEYCEAGEMTMETAGSLKNGSIIWVLAKVNGGFQLGASDKVQGYLLLCNSHDGSLCFVVTPTSVRVVCWNTLSLALGDAAKQTMFRMRHSKKFTSEVAQDAKTKVGLVKERMKVFHEKAHMLTEAKVDRNGQVVKEYILKLTNPDLLEKIVATTEVSKPQLVSAADGGILGAMLAEHDNAIYVPKKITEEDLGRVGAKILESICNSPGSNLDTSKDTWWGVVNGVTHYVDHVAGRDRDTAMQSAWFGERGVMKTAALEMAIQYAEGKVN